MAINPVQFTKYTFKKNEPIPAELNVRGAIAITSDTKHVGWLHVLFNLAQKIHNLLFGRKDDTNMAHGVVILGRTTNDKSKLLVAHAIFEGILTSAPSYLDSTNKKYKDVDGLVIYIPKDANLRELIARNAEQSVFNRANSNEKEKKKIAPFSLIDMGRAFFNRPSNRATKRIKKRTALAVADLLKGDQLKNRANQLRPLYCIAYATMILQSSILLQTLSPQERASYQGKEREQLAKEIYKRIKHNHPSDALAKAYWANEICRINARFVTSSYAAACLDQHS